MMPSSHSLLSSGRLSWRSGLRPVAWAPSRCPFAEGTRGQRAPSNGRLPEAAAADIAALADEQVRTPVACRHTDRVAWHTNDWLAAHSFAYAA